MATLRDILNHPKTTTIANSIVFFLVFITIFIAPLFPHTMHHTVFNILITLTYLAAILSIKKHRIPMFIAAIGTMLVATLTEVLHLEIINGLLKGLNALFFFTVVVFLVIQVARSKQVNLRVILEAINVYLLLGLVFSLLITFLMVIDVNAFNFPFRDSIVNNKVDYFSEYLYYGFVTFTTLGYGDIVPLKPYAKSLAILASVTGQLYVAIIIAMLVGKFSSKE